METILQNLRKDLRDAAYVMPPQASSDSDSDPEMNIPLAKLAKRYRRERENILKMSQTFL